MRVLLRIGGQSLQTTSNTWLNKSRGITREFITSVNYSILNCLFVVFFRYLRSYSKAISCMDVLVFLTSN